MTLINFNDGANYEVLFDSTLSREWRSTCNTKIRIGHSSMASLLHEVRKETVMEIYSFYEKPTIYANTLSIA